jgi:hypothetical protein
VEMYYTMSDKIITLNDHGKAHAERSSGTFQQPAGFRRALAAQRKGHIRRARLLLARARSLLAKIGGTTLCSTPPGGIFWPGCERCRAVSVARTIHQNISFPTR